jgi:hypothetical protein
MIENRKRELKNATSYENEDPDFWDEEDITDDCTEVLK